jgi:flagellar hook assembly protein FlgD
MQNYPNPFNPETVINFAVPAESMVKISVYNSLGEIVSTLVNQQMTAGNHQVKFDASKLSSGLYFYKMVAGEVTITRKMVLSK